MKVAYWNVNMGRFSYKERLGIFSSWCKGMKPDLLLLEEVSHTLSPKLEELSGMQEVTSYMTLNKNLKRGTKELWILQRGSDFTGKSARLPFLKSKRGCVYANTTGRFKIWGLHANASRKGGQTATDKAAEYLGKYDEVIGGDFNYPIQKAKGTKCSPVSWDGTLLNFTQWNKTEGATAGPEPQLHLKKNKTYLYQKIEPHSVIDYVMYGQGRTVVALNNCLDEDQWVNILRYFDHCPILYDIT